MKWLGLAVPFLVWVAFVRTPTVTAVPVTEVRKVDVGTSSGVSIQCRENGITVSDPLWEKDGEEFTNSSASFDTKRVSFMGSTGTITFVPAKPTDEGVYRCSKPNPSEFGTELELICKFLCEYIALSV